MQNGILVIAAECALDTKNNVFCEEFGCQISRACDFVLEKFLNFLAQSPMLVSEPTTLLKYTRFLFSSSIAGIYSVSYTLL